MLPRPARAEVMTTDVLTFAPDENVHDAMRALVDRGDRRRSGRRRRRAGRRHALDRRPHRARRRASTSRR